MIYKGQEVVFSFEGICNSVYEPEAHYLEGAYCGDSGGETTIDSIEVVELQIWNSENEEFIAI